MKIANVGVSLLYDRFVYLKVESDEGLVGWGEATFHGGRITAQTAHSLGQRVIGKDPFKTDAIWKDLFQSGYRVGHAGAYVSALGALDIAFYDMKGKALDTPVWNLLGGKHRDRVPIYSSLMERDLPPEADVERVQDRMGRGFSWVKLHTGTAWSFDTGKDRTVETVRALRDHCGDEEELKILVDVNQAYTVHTAERIGRSLEELGVFHFEEPIAPWDLQGYNRLQAALQVPLAAGEQEFNLWQFRDLITVANMDILQPNLTTCGGYTQGMKIAALAQAFNRPITTHNTDPMLMTAIHLHFWAACSSCIYAQEYFGEDQHPLRDDTPVLKTPLSIENGEMIVPDGPGLGVEIDEKTIDRIGEKVS